MTKKATPTHRTTSRVLDVIEYVSVRPDGASLAQIARDLNIPKSSLHPLTCTLTERKYLYYRRSEERFYAGESLFVYGNRHVSNSELLEQIREVMLKVNEQTCETLYFGVLSELDVLYLIKMDTHSQFRVMSNPGNKLPAYSTGYGKALLSQFSPTQIAAFYPDGALTAITEHTLSTVDALNEQLEQIRSSGFAYEVEESTVGIRCIGLPITLDDQIIAGISIAVPLFRYCEKREEIFKRLLVNAKKEMEEIIVNNKTAWIYGNGTGGAHA